MEIRDYRFNGITKFKSVFTLFLLPILLAFFMVAPALAQLDPSLQSGTDIPAGPRESAGGLGNAFNTGPGSPLNAAAVQGGGFDTMVTFELIVSTVITMVLGLMGVIFLVLAIYGGYTWMMAGGNDEAVGKAKKTITNAIIGIIIVLSAYALVRIIVSVVGSKVFK